MDKSFSALHKKIEEGELLDEAWPKVKLSKARDQHEYDFLTRIGRRLDKAIKVLPGSFGKEFVNIREEIETHAVTLRLADNKDWSAALQIVSSNDKMMKKYKDRIPLAKGDIHLPHQIQKEKIIIRDMEKGVRSLPFKANLVLAPQIIREHLPVSTVGAWSILPPTAPLLVQDKKQDNQKLGASSREVAINRGFGILATQDRTIASGYGL
ncbi:10015_t:CDS:2, partial [Dentiscutata heterogama]